MIVITGTARVRDGAHDRMAAAAATMAAATREEPGCHGCRYGFEIDDADVMVFHEVYASPEALRAHLQTPHMREFYDAGAGLMDGRPDVTMWVGAEQGSMESLG